MVTDTLRPLGDRMLPPIALGNGAAAFAGARDDARLLVRTALDAGIRVFDTARVYTTADHSGFGEEILGEDLAAHPARAEAFVVTKGGHYRDGDRLPHDGRPETIRRHFEESRRHLGFAPDLYLLHGPDPDVPIGRTMEAFAALREEGLVRHVGVDGVTITQLDEARSVVPVTAIEQQFSPLAQADRALLDHCTEHGIAFLAHSPLRGPFLAPGTPTHVDLPVRFPAAARVAARLGVSMPRLALAWLLTLSPRMFVVSGATRPVTIFDSLGASTLRLDSEDLAELDFDERRAFAG